MPITLPDLIAAGAELFGVAHAQHFTDWSYDSRLTTPGSCFVALRTPRADGHDYIAAALAAGATGVLCRWPPPDPGSATVFLAPDPQVVLQRWAAAYLAKRAPTVIAVTGSVGKTTTRRAIAAVLNAHAPTFQSRRSFNSLLGLPIALARLAAQHRYAVLEFGSGARGEIDQLAALFPPQIAVVTAVGEAHLRSFGSIASIAAEKSAVLSALPRDGVAILNADDPHVRAMAGRTAARVFSFGTGVAADLRGTLRYFTLAGSRISFQYGGETLDARLPLLGVPALTAGMAAVSTGLVAGMRLSDAVHALETLEPPAGRLRPLRARSGATVLDDTFSAALPAVRTALTTLASLPARRRIAILGPPADLPPESAEQLYREIGALAAHCADLLIFKGDWGVVAARAIRSTHPQKTVLVADTTAGVLAALPPNCGVGDLILVKGDAVARMERVVAALVAPDPLRKPADEPMLPDDQPLPLLVRQEPVWRSVRVGQPDRPTWLRIDLDAIAQNVRTLRAITSTPIMAVLKADAYGHGAVRVARAAYAAGAQMLAVATLGEARLLRNAEIRAPILVLGYTAPWQARDAVQLGVTCTVFDDEAAQELSAAALEREQVVPVHVKVDTGMGRLGLPPADVGPFLARLNDLPGITVAGLYTHFANADLPASDFTAVQLDRFTSVLDALRAAGLRPPLIHAANSAAALHMPATRFDMIRPGIALYGIQPSAACPLPPGITPALSFHSEIAQVRTHPAGVPLSYGGTFITPQPMRIATIPVGYADGVRRSPAWREVLIRGQRAPIVGRICMDYALVDVTAISGVKRGDGVVLIGSQGDQTISADEVATWLDTISYEVLTSILPRVPREVEE
jgi:alanine racemase